ncbi:nuclear transport factor 2 family protein [Aliagarivorans marinus]|uniref:nuclear transport factor 2 family protein n=1 Tax=Aliagarivorans marinus TaxID=561965 RepID=UPI0003F72A2B|nr:nuclear transport factor 2 family protein [Aliagarivorans marinus]
MKPVVSTLKYTLLAVGLGSLSMGSALAEQSLSNRDKAVAVIESIETGDPSAIAYINPQNYTQHNLGVADGLAGFGEVLQMLPEGSARAKVVRTIEDGDYVALHTEYNFFGPKAGFDIFRFEDGLIVEHWDNLQEVAEPNPSGRTQFDGASEISDIDKTDANKALVADFVKTILLEGNMARIGEFIGPNDEDYLQHNTAVADGLSGLGAALAALAEQGMPMVYTTNHLVIGEGNFVLSVSEGQFLNQHVSFYDLFRVADGKIVEHWDTIEVIPPQAEWKNDNGKFGFQ